MSSHKQGNPLLQRIMHASSPLELDSLYFKASAGGAGGFRGAVAIGPRRHAADAFGVAGPGLCYRHCLVVLAELFLS